MASLDTPDRYAERARPSLLYVIGAILAANYLLLPLAQLFGARVEPVRLPGELLTFFGIVVSGYALSRTAEKIAALPGESEVSVLGLKIGNKPCPE